MRNAVNTTIVIAVVAIFGMGPLASPAGAYGGGRAACRADVEKLCPDAKPGDGSVRTCLHDHEADLSDGCKQAIAHRREHGGHHRGGSDANPNGGDSGAGSNGGAEREPSGAAQ